VIRKRSSTNIFYCLSVDDNLFELIHFRNVSRNEGDEFIGKGDWIHIESSRISSIDEFGCCLVTIGFKKISFDQLMEIIRNYTEIHDYPVIFRRYVESVESFNSVESVK